jgi:hypothetical protein
MVLKGIISVYYECLLLLSVPRLSTEIQLAGSSEFQRRIDSARNHGHLDRSTFPVTAMVVAKATTA